MDQIAIRDETKADPGWPFQIYRTLKAFGVSQISYVPDAGRMVCQRGNDSTVKVTEEL